MSEQDIELEVKFFLKDKKSLEAKLLAVGATMTRQRVHELNLRFDTAENSLKDNRKLLRLRKDHAVHLTFKGHSELEDGVFSREEIEVEIGDFGTGRRLIEALGFQVVVIYEKYRTTYRLDGLEIAVDELPYGDFVEIEGEDNTQLRDYAEKLGLDWETAVKSNYLGLFQDWQKRMGLTFRDLTFENFRGLSVNAEQLGVTPADHI